MTDGYTFLLKIIKMPNVVYRIKKVKVDLILIFFGVLQYAPFSPSSSFNIIFKLIFSLLLGAYLLVNSDLNKKTSFNLFLVSISIMIIYSLYYFSESKGTLNALIVQIVRSFLMISIYLYIITGTHIETVAKIFVKIIIIISIITIISFVGSNTGIIPFPKRVLAGYHIGFNYILGGVSISKLFSFYQPTFYFSEPSYLGFFLGFSFWYLKKAVGIKRMKIKLVIVFIAGVLVFSMTFYATMLIVLLSEFITTRFTSILPPQILSKIYLISFIILSTVYVTQLNVIGEFFHPFRTSFNDRAIRIESSLYTIRHMSTTDFLLGKGPGFFSADKTRNRSESDAFMRAFVENGLILLFIYIFIIYYLLKENPPLLLYSLIALHAVVVLETPLFIFIISLASVLRPLKNSLVAPTSRQNLHQNPHLCM